MGNVLPSDLRLHRRYDLKGSTYGRTVSGPAAEFAGCAVGSCFLLAMLAGRLHAAYLACLLPRRGRKGSEASE